MWTYIANTAPLCGRLIRALAEAEYKIRLKALEGLEKQGGVEERTNPSGRREIVNVRLKNPVYGYLALWGNRLYAIWGEFDDLPKNGRARSVKIERRVLDIINRHRRNERVEMEVDEYEIDREYERLWLEVPLPGDASKLLGGKGKAPVALLRNLGWLLSDDNRFELIHKSSNLGQATVRIFDWVAIVAYAKRGLPSSPPVFKLSVHFVSKTKDGTNPLVETWPIGTAADIIRAIYEQFGIALSGTERVIAHGYAVLNALREEAFKRYGKVYVVDDVGAWIAFSATVALLVLGDGYVMPSELGVVSKSPSVATLKGEIIGIGELAKALGGVSAGKEVRLRDWHMRLLLPTLPTPAFEKTVKLYEVLTNYPAAAIVEIDGVTYLLSHNGDKRFVIGKEKAAKLYEAVKRLGLRIRVKKDKVVLTYAHCHIFFLHLPVLKRIDPFNTLMEVKLTTLAFPLAVETQRKRDVVPVQHVVHHLLCAVAV